jgi:hypothetical protein
MKLHWTVVTSDTTLSLLVPQGSQLVVFLVGGGGGASGGQSGSSGFFHYGTVGPTNAGAVTVTVDLGSGGGTSADGQATVVTVFCGGEQCGQAAAAGGGGDARPGWSGGANSVGGSNGAGGDGNNNGNGEQLPTLCNTGVGLSAGMAGTSTDGTGAGGVYVNGNRPGRRYVEDGLGYGAGGGEDNRSGYAGVAAVFICAN